MKKIKKKDIKKKFWLKSKIIWKDITMLLSITMLTCHDLIMDNIDFLKGILSGKVLYAIMMILTVSSIYIRFKSQVSPLTTKKTEDGEKVAEMTKNDNAS